MTKIRLQYVSHPLRRRRRPAPNHNATRDRMEAASEMAANGAIMGPLGALFGGVAGFVAGHKFSENQVGWSSGST